MAGTEEIKIELKEAFSLPPNIKDLFDKCKSHDDINNFYLSLFSKCERVEKDVGFKWYIQEDLTIIDKNQILYAKVSYKNGYQIFKLGKVAVGVINSITSFPVYSGFLAPIIFLGIEELDVKERSLERLEKEYQLICDKFWKYEMMVRVSDPRSIRFTELEVLTKELLRRIKEEK